MEIIGYVKNRLSDIHDFANSEGGSALRDRLKREIAFLETISVYNQPDLSGDYDELIARLENEDNIIISVDQYDRLVTKANKYDQLKKALRDD